MRILDNCERFEGPTRSVEFTLMKILTANEITYLKIRPIYSIMSIHHFIRLPFFISLDIF